MILADTHVLIWLLQGDARLGTRALALLDDTIGGNDLLISAITPWEMALLVSKDRLPLGSDPYEWINRAVHSPGIRIASLEPTIAIDAIRLPDLHGDPADRIITATARHLKAPLLTADRALLAYGALGHVETIDAGL